MSNSPSDSSAEWNPESSDQSLAPPPKRLATPRAAAPSPDAALSLATRAAKTFHRASSRAASSATAFVKTHKRRATPAA